MDVECGRWIMGQEASHRHQERCGVGGRKKETREGIMGQARGPSGRLPPDLKGKAMALRRKKRNVLCGNVGRQPGWVSIQGQEQALLWGWGSVPCLPQEVLRRHPQVPS